MTARMQQHNTADFVFRILSDDDLARYREDGYLVLGRTLTDQGLERLREECMKAWRAEKGEYDADGTWLDNALLTDVHHRSQFLRDYYFNGPVVDIAEQLISPNIKSVTAQLTFKLRGNTQSFGWHQDNGYGELDPYNALSTLTALDDADLENGCIWLIPGGHKIGQIDVSKRFSVEVKDTLQDLSVEVDDTGATPVSLKAGECLVFHCFMPHKSEGNLSKDRDRRILFMRYSDADAVEVYNDRKPRLGRLVRGETRFPEVRAYEANL